MLFYFINVTYVLIPRIQAIMMNALMVTSTGIKSRTVSGSHHVTRKIPLPPPTSIPTGPLKLSIHPSTGSFIVDVTKKICLIYKTSDN